MPLSPTRPPRILAGILSMAFAVVFAPLGCSPAQVKTEVRPIPPQRLLGKILSSGFSNGLAQWELKGTRYVLATLAEQSLEVQNSAIATGISPIWYLATVASRFRIVGGGRCC